MKNKNNRNFILISIIFLILVLIINYLFHIYYKEKYNKIINNNIGSIINEVKENYNVDEEKIIKIINSDNNNSNDLKKYGIDINKVSVINSIDKEAEKMLLLSNIFIIIVFILYLICFIINMRLRNKQINNVTKTIKKINNKDYSLEIKENSEDELSSLRNELYKVTIMLKGEALNKELEKEKIKEDVASISHQIKTPLTSISILIDNIIEDKNMSDNVKEEFLKDIKKTIFDMNFLVVTLLKLSRFDADVIKFKKDNINVLELINNVEEKLNIILNEKNIKINKQIDSDISFIGDYTWEVEAITNIVKNCIEYSNLNSNIDIKVINNNFYIKIIITDYGKGINEKDRKHIFERFYKGESSTSNSFGIGLSLAKTIIEKDNGFIKVKSDLDKGTTFIIKYMKN